MGSGERALERGVVQIMGSEDEEREPLRPAHSLDLAHSLETEPQVLRTTSSSGGFLQRLLSRQSTQAYFSFPSDDLDVEKTHVHHRWVPEEEAGVVSKFTFGCVGFCFLCLPLESPLGRLSSLCLPLTRWFFGHNVVG